MLFGNLSNLRRLQPLGPVDANNPPIAGFGGIAGTQGLTTQKGRKSYQEYEIDDCQERMALLYSFLHAIHHNGNCNGLLTMSCGGYSAPSLKTLRAASKTLAVR